MIIRLIFSKNIDESDKFCGDFFAKFLIGFASMNIILNGKYIGSLIWAVHWQKTHPSDKYVLFRIIHYAINTHETYH